MFAVQHFFAYFPPAQSAALHRPDLERAFSNIGYRIAPRPYLLGYIPFSTAENEAQSEQIWVRVTPGTEVGARAEFRKHMTRASASQYANETLRLFTLLIGDDDALEITSDPLGVLPYYTAAVGGGTLICSSVRHLLLACPELGRDADDQAVFEFLCCGAPLGPRTLHKRVRLASAGQAIRWERGKELQVDRSNRVRLLKVDPGLGTTCAADEVARQVRESLSKLPSPGVITLTGGFDSRLITCFCFEQKRPVRLVTIGYPQFEETQVAQAVAGSFGATVQIFQPPHPDVLDLVPQWLATLEGLADSITLFIVNLLSLPAADGTPIYHGYIDDTLSGALLPRISVDTARLPEEMASNAAAHFFGGTAADAGERLQLSASVKAAIQDIQNEFVLGVEPHQTTVLWNLENIQRRLAGHQLLYLGQRFMPAPVFYQRSLMELWLSMPRMAIDNRMLLSYIFQKNWPRLSTLPHSEHAPAYLPRTRSGAKYIAGWYIRRMRWRAARRLGASTANSERRTDAWELWHGTTKAQRQKELQQLDETLALIRSRLGWQAPRPTDALWSSCVSIEAKRDKMLRRLYLLGEYAKSLPDWQDERAVASDNRASSKRVQFRT